MLLFTKAPAWVLERGDGDSFANGSWGTGRQEKFASHSLDSIRGQQVENHVIQGIFECYQPQKLSKVIFASYPGLTIKNHMHKLEFIVHSLKTCSYYV